MLKTTWLVATLLITTSVCVADDVLRKIPLGCTSATLTNSLYLKIDGIEGDSVDHCHPGAIEPLSFQSSGSLITIVKKIDLTSPHLFIAALSGTHIPQAELTLFQAGAIPKITAYKMKNVMIGSIDQTAGPTNREVVTLKFTSLVTEVSTTTTTSAKSTTPPSGIDLTFLATGTQSAATLMTSGFSGQLREFVVNKPIDASSPKLMSASQSGQHLQEVVITLRSRGGGPIVYRLNDVVVSGDIQSGSGTSATEQVRLKPGRITMQYNSSTHGPQTTGWDMKTNTKV